MPRSAAGTLCFWSSVIACFHLAQQMATRTITTDFYEGLKAGSTVYGMQRMAGNDYSLHQDTFTDVTSLFEVSAEGVIKSKVVFDYEDDRRNEFDLIILSRRTGSRSDLSVASVVRVKIRDVNDNRPKFAKDLYVCSVSENSPSGTFVFGLEDVFAEDPDSGTFSVQAFDIVAGNEADKFEVDSHDLAELKFLRIKTKGPIDREETAFFTLTVRISDGGDPRLSSTTQVKIIVSDENDNAPVFDPRSFSASVNENSEVGTSILQVKTLDKDIHQNSEVYYYFESGDDFFAIHPHTGVVEVARSLNFERGSFFELQVVAKDRGMPSHQVTTKIKLQLIDVSGFPPSLPPAIDVKQEPPVFDKDLYFVRVKEDFAVGGLVVRVSAWCPRRWQGARAGLLYTQTAGDQRVFSLNSKNGAITLIEPLNFERKQSFTLEIRAELRGNTGYGVTKVRIDIENVEEDYFTPAFEQTTMEISIPVDADENTTVTQVTAQYSGKGKIKYAITGGSGLGQFQISENGKLRPLIRLSTALLSLARLDLVVEAKVSATLRTAKLYIKLQVDRRTGRRPVFTAARHSVDVRENNSRGTFVAAVRAGFHARLAYSLTEESPVLEYGFTDVTNVERAEFSIDSATGILTTAVPLDRERKSLYILDVFARARDGVSSEIAVTQVVVHVTDVNDNTPSFMQKEYQVQVTENQEKIPNLLCLPAYDPDEGIHASTVYSIASGNDAGLFSIDPALGILSVDQALNYEDRSIHRLVVRATDGGDLLERTASASVIIRVRDANDAPVFLESLHEVSIEEDEEVMKPLYTLSVRDEDQGEDGKFTCIMTDMDVDTMDMFAVDTSSRGCTLTLRGYLEWSHRSDYQLTVQVTDNALAFERKSARAKVVVHVLDTNNHQPMFLQTSYWVSVASDALPGASVLQVEATDLDNEANARVHYVADNNLFAVDRNSGVVTLTQKLAPHEKYDFTITATDSKKLRSMVTVSVTTHSSVDQPPKFAEQSLFIEVAEGFNKPGEKLHELRAQDAYGADVVAEYSLVGGDPGGIFAVDSTTGALTLQKRLDYEKVKEHRLVVRALVRNKWSHMEPALACETMVVVNVTDINDNSPRFALLADPVLTIFDRRKPQGSMVAKTQAYDADSGSHGAVTYRLEGAGASHFQIDNKFGEITTKDGPSSLKTGLYEFNVVATDSSPPYRTTRARISVQVHDVNPPPIYSANSHYEVSEEVPIGTSLVKFNQKNVDDQALQFSLVSGNNGLDLCVDTTGELRVQKPLDRERTHEYHLKVHLHKGLHWFLGPIVTINITDVNDNVPNFISETIKVFVRENLPPGQEISGVLATDADEGRLAYTIVNVENSISKGMFSITASGVLTTTESLDREVLEQHVLTVRAQDSGGSRHSALARVVVMVQDENDNPPVFAAHSFEVWVPFGSEAGTPIFRLRAVDDDKARNGMIRFFVISGNEDHYIKINSGSGKIILQKQFVALQPITVKVMARDLGRAPLNSSCNVTIIPLPIRGPPLFVSDPFTGHVMENQDATRVLRISASSEYSVVYSIVSGNEHGSFNLHPGIGEISTTKPLDHEKRTQYILVVRATDTVNRLSEVKVIINVDNENDNGPRLTGAHNGVFEGEIPRNAARNSDVMTLEAHDKDTHDTLSYDIQEEEARRYFWISSSGSLRTMQLLTALASPFEFSVVVQDHGVPPRKVAARVRIILLQHQLSQQTQFSRQVKENSKLGTHIITVQTEQQIPNSNFSIVSPRSTPFHIDPVTGAVSVYKPLDYEKSRQHAFIVQVQNARNARDYTNLHVDIEVLDTNDNAPSFMADRGVGNYLVYINRNAIDGTEVLNVTAKDKDSGLNAILRYRLVSDGHGLFAVDQTSGVIRRHGRSALQLTWYNVTVEAYDLGEPSLSSQAVVSVQVGEFPPQFSQAEYVFSVSENNRRYATVGRVHAKSFSGATLSYNIVQGENRKFILNSITGQLQATASLDFERDANVFHMRVRATETNVKNPLSTDVNVRLFVKDVNDNAPVFVKQRYVNILPESTPVGTAVASVTAVDKDSGINGHFRYHVMNPFFTVNPYTGQVVTARPLDYETAPSHTVHVWAVDRGSPALNGSSRVMVQLKNVNDNPPMFTQSLYQVELSEDARPNEVVATVQASDRDNDGITYSIISGDKNSTFTIHHSTGVVRLVNRRRLVLTGPYYTLNITATDGYHLVSAILIVGIQDINNHKPEFTNCGKYRPHVLEDLPPGQFVLQVSAQDKDAGANGQVRYEIEQPIKAFEIDPDTGIIKSAARFDREEKQFYQIIVKGKDGGKNENDKLEGICQIEIQIDDVNDEVPKFDDSEYTVTVPENMETGGSVLRVSAKDPDAGKNGSVWYNLSAPNDYFAVDNLTGLVTTKKKLQLGRHDFEVLAWDKGIEPNQGRTVVYVEVFGHGAKPPSFTRSVYRAHVREDVSTGHEVITVNTTTMGAIIYYSIETHPTPFSIDPTSGVVRTSISLDYEQKPNYTLTIKAKTSYPALVARAVLHIILEDVNDSPPSFSLLGYKVHVTENSRVGTFVVQVSAEDPDVGKNGLVTYVLRKEDQVLFQIDPVTGVITTKQKFDREKQPVYTLIVTARDNGEQARYESTIVEVHVKDENDNAPVFVEPYYNVTVPEDVPPNTRLLTVSAEDKDVEMNSRVNYFITSGNNASVFAVNKDYIFVATSLDREKQAFYKLGVTATDGKNSNEVMVYVQVTDVNDNNPEFSNSTYEASVKENMPRGTYVITFSATDDDLGSGGNFTFEISGQGLAAFYVDKETGVLRTNGPLDREKKKRYEFLALAKDTFGRTGYADVVINIKDVNDNAPSFPDEPYMGYVLEERQSVDVIEISAVDEDDPNEGGNAIMTYHLLDDANGFFRINSLTGLIQSTGKRLDREHKDKYFVVVKATDQGNDVNGTALWETVNVTIVVLDANDHQPKFQESIFFARVSENADIGSSVTTLYATDGDTGTNAKIRYRIAENGMERMFNLVEETGELQVARSLDYEKTKSYRLNVIATDSSPPFHSDTAEVNVTVEDYNDCAPRFEPVAYTTKVPEDERSGTSLLQVTATDSDTGSNKYFTFSIADGDPSDRFDIDEHTGELFLNAPLDRETLAEYRLTVRASNTEFPFLHGDANVIVEVIDRNDNGPVFEPSTLRNFIKEGEPPPVVVVKLVVTDPDHEAANAGPFTFGLASHNDIFTLDNRTGVLSTRVTFDRETKKEYKVSVWAIDNGGMETHTFVYVFVKDVNDNQHYKGRMELTINAFEGKFPGGDVGKVYVKDEDTDDERRYEMLESSSQYFSVWRNSGKVHCKPNPPPGVHNISVRVSDVISDFHPVVSEVSILVKNIPAEALNKSVAVRLAGLTRRDIVAKFLPSFKETVADILGTVEENVDFFSMQMAPGPHQAVDLRFAAHGSPYYAPERIIALLKNARPKLTSIGKIYNIKYEAIGVDKCLREPCETGGCTRFLTADERFEVISAGDKTFLSLVVGEEAVCATCGAKKAKSSSCRLNPCLNGGTCESPSGNKCRCPLGFDGPRCELTTRSFRSGEWVWLTPLKQCNNGSFSLEFATKHPTGLLLYHGPTSPLEEGDVYDFVAVQLLRGRVLVSMSLGNVSDVIQVSVSGGPALNDGKWHSVRVQMNGTIVVVTVDDCKLAKVTENDDSGRSEDKSACEARARFKSATFKFLNANGPLQLGGVESPNLPYPQLMARDFVGCIRRLTNEHTLYDLASSSNSKGSLRGCPVMDQHCQANTCKTPSNCVPSWSGHTCRCPLGRSSSTCEQETEPVSYDDYSFTRYFFSEKFKYDPRETEIHLMLRTRDSDGGVLLFSRGSEENEVSLLEVVPRTSSEKHLVVNYTFNLGDSLEVIQLTSVDVGDGKWHEVSLQRKRTEVTLTVDQEYSATVQSRGQHTLFKVDPIQTYVGGLPSDTHNNVASGVRRQVKVVSDFVGCLNDVRYNGHSLHHHGTKDIGRAQSSGVKEGCQSREVCFQDSCPSSHWCHDVWRAHACLPRLCLSKPCKNGGMCYEGVDGYGGNKYRCVCPPKYQGAHCEIERAVVASTPDPALESGLIIGICVLIVTLVLSVCLTIIHIRYSRGKVPETPVDEDHFKRDNVVDYHIEGGGEEDIDADGNLFRDMFEVFGEAHTPEKKAARREGKMAFERPCKTSHDRDRPYAAHCACTEPLNTEMICSCRENADVRSTNSAVPLGILSIQRESPEGKEDDNSAIHKGEVGSHSQAVTKILRRPDEHRRRLKPASCECQASQSTPDMPSPVHFLPVDAIKLFSMEGCGSPAVSLSTLGHSETDPETDEFPWQRESFELKDRFDRLAKIYEGMDSPDGLSWDYCGNFR